MKNKFSAVISDFSYNILSSLISTGVIQLVLYPTLARTLSAEKYGSFLTIISVINILTLSLGNNLATTRLIKDDYYRERNLKGDFNILLMISLVLNYVFLYIYNLEFSLDFISFNCVALASSLTIIRTYLSVAFRLKLDYKKNLILNIIIAIGFAFCTIFFADFDYWPIIYIISNVMGIIYMIFTYNLLNEPYRVTTNFKKVFKVYIFLVLSGFIANLTTYLDKLIIYPVLGASSVSVYSVASFLGKSLALIIPPITSVFLSYLCTDRFKMTKKLYKRFNIMFTFLAVITFLVCLLFEKPITKFLYPTVYEKAMPYIIIANFASILGILSSFNGTITLKYAPSFWQVILSVIKITVYVILCCILMNKYKLYGFAVGLAITNFVNIIMNYYIGLFYIGKRRLISNV